MIDKNHTIYLAGPMSGIPGWNYDNFFRVEKQLRDAGFESVLNPAKNDKDPDMHHWREFMRDAISLLVNSDAAVFLDGWSMSRGAKIEMFVARELGMPVLDERLDAIPEHTGETVCQEADRLVSGDRGDSYGHPFHDFTKTGKMWGAILGEWAKESDGDAPVPPELVGLCMIALKLSREAHKPKRDNRVDIAGYAKCVDMIHSKLSLEELPEQLQ